MDIGGYTIDNKYLAAGAAGLGILFLVNRNKNAAPSNVATLQPADGLTWADVIGQPASGLVGGTGEGGPPGPPGPAGPPGGSGSGDGGGGGGGKTCAANGAACTKNRDCCGSHVCVNDICTKPTSGNGNGGGGGGGNGGGGGGNTGGCSTNDDCRKNEKCRHGQCVSRDSGGGKVSVPRGEGPGHGNPTNPRNNPNNRNPGNQRPAMPSTRDNPLRRGMVTPPDVRSPRDQNNRDQGNNRIFRDNSNGNNIRIIDRGGHAVDRGRDANANASGGSVQHGNINGPGRTRIDVSGGHATANASGGNGNQTGNNARRTIRHILGRGGEVASNDYAYNGYGRMDGAGNQSSDYVNTHPQSGGSVGGFSPVPMPTRPYGSTTTVQNGESLRGVAKRVYGYDHFVPRLYQLNQDLLIGRTTLEAGTVLKV